MRVPSARTAGFTLIELVLTLTIIGVLTAIITPSFNTLRIRAKETNVKATANALQIALESYYLNNGIYPASSTINTLMTTLSTDGVWPSGGTKNPFTQQGYSDSDSQGRIVYTLTNGIYQITVYGHTNQVIMTYPN